jgi:hypothetical protein
LKSFTSRVIKKHVVLYRPFIVSCVYRDPNLRKIIVPVLKLPRKWSYACGCVLDNAVFKTNDPLLAILEIAV